jgi:chemotaxis signal transduction protein
MEDTNQINFFVFKEGKNIFCLYLNNVGEVIQYKDHERLPSSPVYVKGVIAKRGVVIPIISLMEFLDKEKIEKFEGKHIVLCLYKEMQIGFMVDKIYGLREINVEANIDNNLASEFFLTGFKINIENEEKSCALLDLDKLIPELSKI